MVIFPCSLNNTVRTFLSFFYLILVRTLLFIFVPFDFPLHHNLHTTTGTFPGLKLNFNDPLLWRPLRLASCTIAVDVCHSAGLRRRSLLVKLKLNPCTNLGVFVKVYITGLLFT